MQLLSRAIVAKMLGISTKTLDRMTAAGDGPPVTRLGGRVLFAEEALGKWLEAHSGNEPEKRQ